jgi:hypothetical protein
MKIYTLRPDIFTLHFNFTLSGTRKYTMDANHTVYHFQGVWKLANHPGHGSVTYYPAPKDVPGQGPGVPETWGACLNISVSCADGNE